jgi:hypothetical protein
MAGAVALPSWAGRGRCRGPIAHHREPIVPAATQTLGGGSSAVAASSHAACARFRGTDPLVTGLSRRKLADVVGFPDVNGEIPEARWMRAMTFERLVRDERFASEVATTAIGRLGLERPAGVVIADAHINIDNTASLLAAAHVRAVEKNQVTLIHGLALPFVGFEDADATAVKPDFAVVAGNPDAEESGSWLVVGDAKDYERLRSRIADGRLLKGFLQVAVGAESAASWSKLPVGMEVHRWGVLAVPRNAFLQPQALVEDVSDHRAEVRMRVAERRRESSGSTFDPTSPLADHVAHLKATFDPSSCATCTLFAFCRGELRRSSDPGDLLIEIGVPEELRPDLIGLLDGTGEHGDVPASVLSNVRATISGVGRWTGQRRVDPAGPPGTVNLLIAKSDATALGLHGLAIQQVSSKGRGKWATYVYEDPHHPNTRRAAMRVIGEALKDAMRERRRENKNAPSPVHLVVPEQITADVLVSIADNLAGIELSRLRWDRDREEGRPPLTFDGEPATIPRKLSAKERIAVSFLLEEDRARAFKLRSPIVDLRAVLARHLVAGGPAVNSLRLDYLAPWSAGKKVDHRELSDAVEGSAHTPGARLIKSTSDKIHAALTGNSRSSKRKGAAKPKVYRRTVEAELAYKSKIFGEALDALEQVEPSNLRDAYRAVEGAAQAVWRRRLALHASDLVRFGRTYRWWRNRLVPSIESDARCHDQLLALANPQAAEDLAASAGNREIAFATVVSVGPIVIEVESRRIGDGDRIVLLHVDGAPCVEGPGIVVDTKPKGSFKIDGLSIGPLDVARTTDSDPPHQFGWTPKTVPAIEPGARLIVADFSWFSDNKGNRFLNVKRAEPDSASSPGLDCTPEAYEAAPHQHRFCCRSHEAAEAEFSDQLALRRSRGELNPETWPPIVDGDEFEVEAKGAPVGEPDSEPAEQPPENVTIDDLE